MTTKHCCHNDYPWLLWQQQTVTKTYAIDVKHSLSIPPYLDRSFWEVVWVSKLGRDIETKVLGVLNSTIPQPDADAAALFECLFQKDRLQDGVQFFAYILQQNLQGVTKQAK